jgi:hypothetical protein
MAVPIELRPHPLSELVEAAYREGYRAAASEATERWEDECWKSSYSRAAIQQEAACAPSSQASR